MLLQTGRTRQSLALFLLAAVGCVASENIFDHRQGVRDDVEPSFELMLEDLGQTDGWRDSSSRPSDFVRGDNVLYFYTSKRDERDVCYPHQLWTYEGDNMLLIDIPTEDDCSWSAPDDPTFYSMNGSVYFALGSGREGGKEIWKYDPSAGSASAQKIYEGNTRSTALLMYNNAMYFTDFTDDPLQRTLYVSDGTAEGTQPLELTRELTNGTSLHGSSKYLFFTPDYGQPIWLTDGQFVLKPWITSPQYLFFVSEEPIREDLYLHSIDLNGTYRTMITNFDSPEPWMDSSTLWFAEKPMGVRESYKVNNTHTIFVAHDRNLWITDGTLDGSFPYYSKPVGNFTFVDMCSAGPNKLLINHFIDDNGTGDFYITDGTATGTYQVYTDRSALSYDIGYKAGVYLEDCRFLALYLAPSSQWQVHVWDIAPNTTMEIMDNLGESWADIGIDIYYRLGVVPASTNKVIFFARDDPSAAWNPWSLTLIPRSGTDEFSETSNPDIGDGNTSSFGPTVLNQTDYQKLPFVNGSSEVTFAVTRPASTNVSSMDKNTTLPPSVGEADDDVVSDLLVSEDINNASSVLNNNGNTTSSSRVTAIWTKVSIVGIFLLFLS